MDEGDRKDLTNFICGLTSHNYAEIDGYISEIISNTRFHHQLDDKRHSTSKSQHSNWSWGISPTLGIALYSICRLQKPGVVAETGVSSGVSSSYILLALEENRMGELYSIDPQPQSGWLIPDYLRHRWHFMQGTSAQELIPLLVKAGQIDIFLHDGEHTYQNMLWEFQTAWPHLKAGGILLSHNIDFNHAFSDFSKQVGIKAQVFSEMGGIVKPNQKERAETARVCDLPDQHKTDETDNRDWR